jgi:hypothetical protein
MRELCFALLPMKRSLPSQRVSKERQIRFILEDCERVVVELEGPRRVTELLGLPSLLDEAARPAWISLRHKAARP